MVCRLSNLEHLIVMALQRERTINKLRRISLAWQPSKLVVLSSIFNSPMCSVQFGHEHTLVYMLFIYLFLLLFTIDAFM